MNPAHLDYDALADLAEGLLDDDHAASANAHLDYCADCRERSAELADLSRILAEIPVPPMPAELATRIDDAIRAESMSTATVASLEERRGRRHLRVFSIAAATVVAIGGAAVVGNSLVNSSSLHKKDAKASSDNPAGASADASGKEGHPGIRSAPGDAGQSPTPGPYEMTRSGTSYRGDTLARQVSAFLKPPSQRLRHMDTAAKPAIADCVAFVGKGQTPALVDAARFDGRPATVIVLPGGPGSWNVVVVGPKCAAQNADLIKTVQIPR